MKEAALLATAAEILASKKTIASIAKETLNVQFVSDKDVFSKFRKKLKYHDIVARDFLNYIVVEFVNDDTKLDKIFNEYLMKKFNVYKTKKSHEAALKNIKGTFDELDKEALYDLINQELKNKDE
jgi:hypothetical protein